MKFIAVVEGDGEVEAVPVLLRRPTADQAAWSAGFDMHLARRRSRSFDKMWRAVQALLH